MPTPSGISPAPPNAPGSLPWIGSALPLLRDPVGTLARVRARVGDTFRVDFFGYEILFVFSPQGVANLWAAPERELSKGYADFEMLRRKVPDELFAGRRTRPHDLFSRDDVAEYLTNVDDAVEAELAALGDRGEVELFALSRRVSHRVGLASWGGVTGSTVSHLDGIVRALDTLDSSDSFVRPLRTLWTSATGKRAERRALADLEGHYLEILRHRDGHPRDSPDLFDRICEKWSDVDSPEKEIGVARDALLTHMGSMSNLFAANAWAVIHLVQNPTLLARVRGGDSQLLTSCVHETVRLRQRSIVLRRATRETSLADEKTAYRLGPGVFAATMMPNTNTSAAPRLGHFEPTSYVGARFARAGELETRELVTTFGHGRHACPAMRFSIESICSFVGGFFDRFEVEPLFANPQPRRNQIGGVARSDRPCRVRYSKRPG